MHSACAAISLILVCASMRAQEPLLLPEEHRLDCPHWIYHDRLEPHALSEHKGRVVVVAFLNPNVKVSAQAARELRYLQRQEGRLPLKVLPFAAAPTRSKLDDSLLYGSAFRPGMRCPGMPPPSYRITPEDPLRAMGLSKDLRLYQAPEDAIFSLDPQAATAREGVLLHVLDKSGRRAWTLEAYKPGLLTKIVQGLLKEDIQSGEGITHSR